MKVRHKVHGAFGETKDAQIIDSAFGPKIRVIWYEAKPGASRYPLLSNLVFRVPCGTRRLA